MLLSSLKTLIPVVLWKHSNNSFWNNLESLPESHPQTEELVQPGPQGLLQFKNRYNASLDTQNVIPGCRWILESIIFLFNYVQVEWMDLSLNFTLPNPLSTVSHIWLQSQNIAVRILGDKKEGFIENKNHVNHTSVIIQILSWYVSPRPSPRALIRAHLEHVYVR